VTARDRQVLELVANRGAVRVPEVASATGLSNAEALDALIELEGGGLLVASVFRITADGREAAR
jgi:predicted ArsR family transcriptional regulator